MGPRWHQRPRTFAPQASVVATGVREDVGYEYTCFIRGVKTHVFMNDLVVKTQAIDIVEIILRLLRLSDVVQTSWRNRKSWGELLSSSETHWSTTKSSRLLLDSRVVDLTTS